jgi:hypothetical protein
MVPLKKWVVLIYLRTADMVPLKKWVVLIYSRTVSHLEKNIFGKITCF